MTYALHYCAPLAVFRLTCETTGMSHPKTEETLREEFAGDATLLAWLAFAKNNPGKDCVYSMLPPSEEVDTVTPRLESDR